MSLIAVTRPLGEQLADNDAQPEVLRWTHSGVSHVTCEFTNGRLVTWVLYRPPVDETPEPAGEAGPGSPAGV